MNGWFVLALAHHSGRMESLNPLLHKLTLDPVTRTRGIAAIFAGVPTKSTTEQVIDI